MANEEQCRRLRSSSHDEMSRPLELTAAAIMGTGAVGGGAPAAALGALLWAVVSVLVDVARELASESAALAR